jgi:Family of unknown function (DUF5681)
MIGRPFQKGKSGNPSGRPKISPDVMAVAKSHTVEAIQTLAAIMRNPKAPHASRVAAAAVLLKKTLPDLGAIEHKGDIVQSFVMRIPEPAASVEAWQQQVNSKPLPNLTDGRNGKAGD